MNYSVFRSNYCFLLGFHIIPALFNRLDFAFRCQLLENITDHLTILFGSVAAGESASEIFHNVTALGTIHTSVLNILEHHVLYLITLQPDNTGITGKLLGILCYCQRDTVVWSFAFDETALNHILRDRFVYTMTLLDSVKRDAVPKGKRIVILEHIGVTLIYGCPVNADSYLLLVIVNFILKCTIAWQRQSLRKNFCGSSVLRTSSNDPGMNEPALE